MMMDDNNNNRILKDITTDELIIIFHHINFQECVDIIQQNNITGEMIANITKIEDFDHLQFPIENNTIRKKLLFMKLKNIIHKGVPIEYLNEQVIYMYTYIMYYIYNGVIGIDKKT
jgi:hypothetical protein